MVLHVDMASWRTRYGILETRAGAKKARLTVFGFLNAIQVEIVWFWVAEWSRVLRWNLLQ